MATPATQKQEGGRDHVVLPHRAELVGHLDGLQAADREDPRQRAEHGRQRALGGQRRGGRAGHRAADGGAQDKDQHRGDHDLLGDQLLRVPAGRVVGDEQGQRGEHGEGGRDRDAPPDAGDRRAERDPRQRGQPAQRIIVGRARRTPP